MNVRLLCAAPALLCCCALSNAQSFNIDLDEPIGGVTTGAGVPSDAFGAASGQVGRWNAMPAYSGAPRALVGLDGLATSAVIDPNGGTGSSGGYNNPNLLGDFRALMADYAFVGQPIQYVFSGLQPGHYEVFVYGGDVAGNLYSLFVAVAGSSTPTQTITGPVLDNQFALGVDYSLHQLDLTGSTFEIDLSREGVTGPSPEVHGFQIVYTPVPEPATLSAAVAAGVLFTLRRRTHVS